MKYLKHFYPKKFPFPWQIWVSVNIFSGKKRFKGFLNGWTKSFKTESELKKYINEQFENEKN
jgi:hypothetical protein